MLRRELGQLRIEDAGLALTIAVDGHLAILTDLHCDAILRSE